MLSGGLGPPLMQRYKRDALEQPGIKYLMIFEGVNDIGSAAASSSTQTSIGNQLISAYTTILTDARKANLTTIMGTITPFCGSGQSYSSPVRETTRQTINKWIKAGGNGLVDHVVDFAAAVEDKNTVSQLASQYNGGDYLHPNGAGYQAMANAFPLDVFA